MLRQGFAIGLLAGCWGTTVAAQPSFTATDLSTWTNVELEGLPYFENYVPFAPTGATASFAPAARSGEVFVGSYDGYYGDYAARIDDGAATNLPPLGVYYWSYTTCDATDCHFYNGRVGFSHLLDVNTAGRAVGDSTLAGAGSSSIGYQTHAVVSLPRTGALVDLTPAAQRAAATSVNNAGQIVGWQQNGGAVQGMRWLPDGTATVLDDFGSSVTPTCINKYGRVAGDAVNVSQSYFNPRAFVSEAGATTELLPLPSQGGVEYSTALDLNNSGWAGGASWKAAAPTERYASLWTRSPSGQWSAYDVNELADGGDFVFQQTLAVNDEGFLIVQGKEDADFGVTHLFLLTPDELLTPPARLAGDYNDDARVSGADFITWQRAYGAEGPFPVHGNNADGNDGGTIEGGDLVVWQSNFGAPEASSSVTAIPEPASAILLAAGAAMAVVTATLRRLTARTQSGRASGCG